MNARGMTAAALAWTFAIMAAPSQAPAASCLQLANVPFPSEGKGIRVEQLCRNAAAVRKLENVPVTSAGARNDVALTLDYHLLEGTGFTVPFHSFVDIVSERGNKIRATAGTHLSVEQDRPIAESFDVEGTGSADFSVENALDFWSVGTLNRFVAAPVRGTRFSIDLHDPQKVTFTATRGAVTITRLVSARILATSETIGGLRASVKIAPSGPSSVTYPRDAEIYRQFKDRDDAAARFKSDAAAATLANDAIGADNAEDDLALLYATGPAAPVAANAVAEQNPASQPASAAQSTPAPAAPAAAATTAPEATTTVNSTPLFVTLGASVAASVIYLITSNHKTTTTAPQATAKAADSNRSHAFAGIVGGLLRSLLGGAFGSHHASFGRAR